MSEQADLLATPWSRTGVPVPELPATDGPPELARVRVAADPAVPAQRTDVPADA